MMKLLKLSRIFILLLACNFVSNAYSQSPTEPANGFNVFIQNDVLLKTNETDGPFACGGDLTISGNYQVATNHAGNFLVDGVKVGLLIGGKVNYQSGSALQVNQNAYVKIGEGSNSYVWYRDQNYAASPIRITPSSNYNSSPIIMMQANAVNLGVSVSNNPVIQGGLIDFSSAFQTMQTSALNISKCQNNVQITNYNGQSVSIPDLPSQININLQEGLNYLNISGSELNNVQEIKFTQKPSATKIFVINVDAPGTFHWSVWNQAGIALNECPYIIYNFFNTTNLDIEGNATIEGTVFAPFADIVKTVNQSNIEGQVVGQSFVMAGGEVHYACFIPELEGCATPPETIEPPVASFTVEPKTQCLEANIFPFVNTSTWQEGTEQPTYFWDFGDGTTSTEMNPLKSYQSAGNFTVELTTTNSYGSTSHTIVVNVSAAPIPVLSETIVEPTDELVSKQITLVNSADFNSYSWAVSNGASGLYPNQAVVDFTFSSVGYYEVTVNATNELACQSSAMLAIVVETPDVNGGNDGGLESESLGDQVSKRYLHRKMSSAPTKLIKTDDLLFEKSRIKTNSKGELTLESIFPTELIPGDKVHVTSPTDILDYDLAEEVLSLDYSFDENTKAVVLGIQTANKPYGHTKAICDRLRGAEITKLELININEHQFVLMTINQPNGLTEYAVSFSIGKNSDENNYSLESSWMIRDIAASQTMYNFQVWSTRPEYTQKLVKDILTTVNNDSPLNQNNELSVPSTFISKVSRKGSELELKLKSSLENQRVEILFNEDYNETDTLVGMRYNPSISQAEQTMKFPIADTYQSDGTLLVNGEIQDAFYSADGNWGLDYDANNTTVNSFRISNNLERTSTANEFNINRNVELEVYSDNDYLTLYKALLPGNLSGDFTEYNSLTFTAKGGGLLDLGLVKSSITDWRQQYKATINLSNEENVYTIPFTAFASEGNAGDIIVDDLSMLTFTFIPEKAGTNELTLSVSDVKFSNTGNALGISEMLKNEYLVYPNPSEGAVNCILYSDKATEAVLTLYNATGRLVYRKDVQLVTGRNELSFVVAEHGIMLMKISSATQDFGTSKIIIK